jgi:hypothetical protein
MIDEEIVYVEELSISSEEFEDELDENPST